MAIYGIQNHWREKDINKYKFRSLGTRRPVTVKYKHHENRFKFFSKRVSKGDKSIHELKSTTQWPISDYMLVNPAMSKNFWQSGFLMAIGTEKNSVLCR